MSCNLLGRVCGARRGLSLAFLVGALSLGLLAPLPGWAAEITVENRTGRIIRELRWSRPSESDRLAQAVPGGPIAPGASLSLPGPEGGRVNLTVIFDDGEALTYHGLELENFRHLELGRDEAALFEWNPAAEKPAP